MLIKPRGIDTLSGWPSAERGRYASSVWSQISFKRHRFPPEIIQHAVWLYARFTLSFRDVEDLLAERGIDVSNETVRRWFLKFGRLIAVNLRRNRPRASARWHLDEMVIKIRGRNHWLWRAVDDEGEVLDFLVQPRRCARSARRLLRKLLKKQGFAPERITTDKLKSYAVAIREERLSAVHDSGIAREQSGGEFPSAGPAARTKTTAVQITGIRPTVPVDPRCRLQRLLRPTPSSITTYFQGFSSRNIRCLAAKLARRLSRIMIDFCRPRQLICQCPMNVPPDRGILFVAPYRSNIRIRLRGRGHQPALRLPHRARPVYTAPCGCRLGKSLLGFAKSNVVPRSGTAEQSCTRWAGS